MSRGAVPRANPAAGSTQAVAVRSTILVSEVGPRDGLQSIASVMPTEAKKRWITALAAATMAFEYLSLFRPG